MPKQSLKLKVAKACAIACIVGMSGNTFVVAGKSIAIKSETAAVERTDFSPEPQPTPPADSPAAQNQTRQSEEGRRYGSPGFMGEPINLNVVNADIRDILNYITEQYGINFVIDSSVGAVPVTVNVQDVPWNYALDALLRANRLGVEVNGNILRVATSDILAKEAEVQKIISDARLDNSPLVTEFVRLNYARASGTLATAAGTTAGYAGGTTSGSFSGGVGGDTAGGSDQGLLPIIKRRLSRRGAVEVDGRSNTLIITDVKENIEAVRQLVAILDQPEPQVEIETRVVIAQRNFSRDLGAQLSMSVLGGSNPLTQAVGSLSTLPQPSQGGGNSGKQEGVAPRSNDPIRDATSRFLGPFQPNGNLSASSPNTVIGLTTGVFGTAQIALLISAGESRGEAKTVATPRVTALNNRPAQIESGSQIPVQTTQATGGGTTVTTTFVSVPLRLSITPQITDAGTVVLRVTIENNTLNSAIAVGGVPGIDTQRMQSEVLVPDGGTTVMGGVLAELDSTSRHRTPGAGSLPLLGHLFKRKAVIKSSLEILFFITPKIYRPDYFGRPTTNTPTQERGPRTTTVPQPVPLGNPGTNTPTPTELQQPKPTSNPTGNQPSGPALSNGPARPSEQK